MRCLSDQEQAGQSIVEVIIAIAIVSTALAAALTVTTAALNAQTENEGWMIGTNLAREGVEVVRNLRDSNWLADRDFDDGLWGEEGDNSAIVVFDPATGDWVLDFQPESLNSENTRVWRYASGHLGTYVQAVDQPANTVPTRYYRLIQVSEICSDHTPMALGATCPLTNPMVGLRVRSRVSWQSSSRDRETEIVQDIYDWR
jgi:type II secretory pathway pseudopilin PulG